MSENAGEFFQSVNPDESSLNANGFVGVDPIYQNFANKTDAPLEDGDEPAEEAEPVEEAKETEAPKTPKVAKPA